MAGTFALTNSATRVDQAVSAVHSGLFVNGTGVVYTGGSQSINGNKTFNNNLVAAGNFSATGVSGDFLPSASGASNFGSVARPFNTGYFGHVSSNSGNFNVLTVGTLNANLNIGATGISNLSVTGTGYIQNIRNSGNSLFDGTVTLNAAITSTGNNTWSGQNNFAATNFKSPVFFESTSTTSGAANFPGGISSGPITGATFYQTGSSTMSGSLTHSGTISQIGNSTFIGNIGVNGTSLFTGSVGITGGNVTIRAATLLTTGSSPSDRLGIVQNIDHSGNLNTSGHIYISQTLNVTGNQTNLGVLSVANTGYFNGVRTTGTSVLNGLTTITGTNSIQGTNYVAGSTRVTGNFEVANTTGDVVSFDSYFRPYIVASGIGTSRVDNLTIANFFANGTAIAPAIGTGKWVTTYTGRIGEIGLLLTGSSNSINDNNDLPLGTFGKVFQLVNVGTNRGYGIWYPLGI